MALKTCKECGHELSTKADACPNCGAVKRKPRQYGCGSLILLLLLAGFLISLFAGGNKTTTHQPTTKAELRLERIKKGFSPWDGSHIGLERAIKHAMNDPKSYEHVETRYIDKGDYLIVTTTFRGKNALGGIVVNRWTAKADPDGKVLQITSQEP